MARRRPAEVHGVLAIDKPAGLTSRAVVNAVARGLGERRVGHCGTLDPMATGVLVVAVGEATSVVPWLMDARKAYDAVVRFGAETETDDREGAVVRQAPPPALSLALVEAHLPRGPTTLLQRPPAVSALQREGVRDHERVRRGEVVERAPRPVLLYDAAVLAVDASAATATLRLEVGAGFYVRALARDLGQALGSAAHLAELRRIRGSWVAASGCWSLEAWLALAPEERRLALLPLAAALRPIMPVVTVDDALALALRRGQRPRVAELPGVTGPGQLLAVTADGQAVAVAEVSAATDPEDGPAADEATPAEAAGPNAHDHHGGDGGEANTRAGATELDRQVGWRLRTVRGFGVG